MDATNTIALLSLTFVGSHLLLSHPPMRSRAIARLGHGPFLGVYSLVSLVVWVPLVYVWWTHRHAGALFWAFRGDLVVHLAELVAAAGLALMVSGMLRPAPASVSSRTQGKKLVVRGAVAITRHPLFMGIALLCLAHMIVNGWASDLWFMGSHVVLSVLGAVHQDQRHRAARPEYGDFIGETSLWPNPLGLRHLDARTWLGMGVGIGLAVLLRFAHRWF